MDKIEKEEEINNLIYEIVDNIMKEELLQQFFYENSVKKDVQIKNDLKITNQQIKKEEIEEI